MKTTFLIFSLMLIGAAIVSSPLAYAQGTNSCNNTTAAGSYTVTCSGWTIAHPATPAVPVMQVGVAKADTDGNWSGTVTINIGGAAVIAASALAGKTTVNANCTGTITFNKGTSSELNISYVMNPKSEEIFGMVTDQGTVASCVLKRINYSY